MWANRKLSPRSPWFLIGTAIWLVICGGGWTATARRARRPRAASRPARSAYAGRVWAWALIAGGLGTVSVMGLALLTGRVADLPPAAYESPFDLTSYPPWTVAAVVVSIAAVAGVVEEAAFRGYMMSGIERGTGGASRSP